MDNTVIKLPLKDKPGTHIYAMVTWNPRLNTIFDVKIFDDRDASWSGRLSTSDAEVYIENMSLSVTEYCDNVKKCFTDLSHLYAFAFHADGNKAEFTWEKEHEDSIIQKLGSVSVCKDTVSESKNTLIDQLMDKNKVLLNKVAKLNNEIEILTNDVNESKKALIQLVDVKTSLESSLYEKFVHLLNAKKQRIQLLEENIRDCKGPLPGNISDID